MARLPSSYDYHAASRVLVDSVGLFDLLVPPAGLEPTRRFRQRILSPVRLPFRHDGLKWWALQGLNLRPGDYESLALTN